MIRSVMEGVTFSLKDCLNIIADLGVRSARCVLRVAAGRAGSGSRCRLMFSAFLSRPPIPAKVLPWALRCCRIGTGVYKDVAEACDVAIKPVEVQQPNTANTEVYSKFYKLYCQLYKSLKQDFKELAQIMKSI